MKNINLISSIMNGDSFSSIKDLSTKRDSKTIQKHRVISHHNKRLTINISLNGLIIDLNSLFIYTPRTYIKNKTISSRSIILFY